MVGGVVVEVLDCGDRVWINVQDTAEGRTAHDRCAIYVEATPEARQVRRGDSLWWQGRQAFWTRREAIVSQDVPIPRIGYSGVRHPAAAMVDAAYG